MVGTEHCRVNVIVRTCILCSFARKIFDINDPALALDKPYAAGEGSRWDRLDMLVWKMRERHNLEKIEFKNVFNLKIKVILLILCAVKSGRLKRVSTIILSKLVDK